MKELTFQEHVTALFILAIYEWYMGEEDNAKHVVLVAKQIVDQAYLAHA